jgi:hypothetical protein
MLTGVAITIPTVLAGVGGLPFGWEFAAVVIALTLLFYIRVYGPGSGRWTARRGGRVPERSGNDGHSGR